MMIMFGSISIWLGCELRKYCLGVLVVLYVVFVV